MHLMYKALFELSADRAEFLSRLFSRKRPAGLDAAVDRRASSSTRTRTVEPSRALYDENLQAIRRRCSCKKHGFKLTADDLTGIEYVYQQLLRRRAVPGLRAAIVAGRGAMRYPTYAELQVATDGQGSTRALSGERGQLPRR